MATGTNNTMYSRETYANVKSDYTN